jgi:uncharacterized membrane protein YgcG
MSRYVLPVPSRASTRRSWGPVWLVVAAAFIALALLTSCGAASANAPGSFGAVVRGQHIYDRAHVLTSTQIATLEQRATRVVQAGAPIIVYLRARDASYDQTLQDARDLMNQWDVESRVGAHDGVVFFFNLNPNDLRHGEAALYAGAKHYDGGHLPQQELQRIYDDTMAPRLRTGDIFGGISAGLDAAAHSLTYGPPPPSAIQQVTSFIAGFPLNIFAWLVVVAIGWQYRRGTRLRRANPPLPPRFSPPGNLAPAIAGSLVLGRVTHEQVQAVVLGLAQKDGLVIEPVGRRDIQLRVLDRPADLNAWEAQVWQVLSTAAGPDGLIEHRHLSRLANKWGPAVKALRADLLARGWYDVSNTGRRLPLYLLGASALMLGVAGFVLAGVGQQRWGFLGAAVLCLAGVLGLAIGAVMPETSMEGEREATPWRAYQAGLKALKRRTDVVVELDVALPYAVALGMAGRLKTRLKQASVEGYVPAWFGHGLEDRWGSEGFYPYWVVFGHSVAAPPSSGAAGGAAAGGGGAGGSF